METIVGFLSRVTGYGRLSRLIAKPKLINLLKKQQDVDGSMIDVHENAETVVLKNKNKKVVDYRDTKFTHSSRRLPNRYNQLLRNQHIDIDFTDYPGPAQPPKF